MASLERPNAVLDYSEEGGGPLAVYAHGAALSREAEDRFLNDWAPFVAMGNRLVRYDARGHGRSTGRPEADDYRFEVFADDLIALVDGLGGGPVNALGSSLGTATTLHAAVKAPDRFRALVLMIPPTAWETRPAQQAIYRQGADVVESKGMLGLAELLGGAAGPEIFAQGPALPMPDVAESLLPAVMRGLGQSDLPAHEEVAKITLPTLILSWATDPGHPVSTGEKLHELLPNSEFHVSMTVDDVRTWTTKAADFLSTQ
ncbi:alpha/beta fold hydrolase [Nonomuraea sediminis]|uniref:alpha/beta fold hydrolase n=1 Tax=Nonomuraea sediminis TaxID=2835864 RepID=UPI001BDC3723|nr:alpha/beta fold hydrolase [Nonomuraea sediminis]